MNLSHKSDTVLIICTGSGLSGWFSQSLTVSIKFWTSALNDFPSDSRICSSIACIASNRLSQEAPELAAPATIVRAHPRKKRAEPFEVDALPYSSLFVPSGSSESGSASRVSTPQRSSVLDSISDIVINITIY